MANHEPCVNQRGRNEKGLGCVAPTIVAPTIDVTTIDDSEIKRWPLRGPHHRVENVMPMVR
jgi:hypothetical protein